MHAKLNLINVISIKYFIICYILILFADGPSGFAVTQQSPEAAREQMVAEQQQFFLPYKSFCVRKRVQTHTFTPETPFLLVVIVGVHVTLSLNYMYYYLRIMCCTISCFDMSKDLNVPFELGIGR